MKHWWEEAFFYHIYPLGFCDAPGENDFHSDPEDRLIRIEEALPSVEAVGCNALYLGPVFESSTHGYDTADYYAVDRRLGDEAALRRLVDAAHARGIRVILDGVFHHVGRDFPAFRRLRETGEEAGSAAAEASWFRGVDFSSDNRYGDGFVYHAWEGNEELVALDLANPEVVNHLLGAVEWMMRDLAVDGLRLDVAYLLPPAFMQKLRSHTDRVAAELGTEDFWLMGEAIHGDYTELVTADRLHSATNYECYKGLWSSHNDGNYFEIAHSLSRQFAPGGIYEGMLLYNFADNHDVDRVASILEDSGHLFPLYALLMTMPGIPSVYYGSEFAARGSRRGGSDAELRPAWSRVDKSETRLRNYLAELAAIRRDYPALRTGSYRELHVAHTSLAFERGAAQGVAAEGTAAEDGAGKGGGGNGGGGNGGAGRLVVAVNAASESAEVELPLGGAGAAAGTSDAAGAGAAALASLFEPGRRFTVSDGAATVTVPAYGCEILRVE